MIRVIGYYGSTKPIREWDITKTREFGYHFAVGSPESSVHRVNARGWLYTVDVVFKNAVRAADQGYWDLKSVLGVAKVDARVQGDLLRAASVRARELGTPLSVEKNVITADMLNARGIDAILYENQGEAGGPAVIVWNPEQIRTLHEERLA